MKVLSYSVARKRIEWQRALKLSAARHDILKSLAHRLRRFEPNTEENIKHPWKLRDPFTIRAWCPLHGGRWARLIVRVDEVEHVTYECNQGCSSGDVEAFLNQLTPDRGRNADSISRVRSTSHSCQHLAQPGKSRSSIHSSDDGRRLCLVPNLPKEVA